MKHTEIYDKHADRRSKGKPKKKSNDNRDTWERHARTSFKNFIRDLKQSELEDEMNYDDSDDDLVK